MPADSTLLLAGLFILAAASGWAYARYSERDEVDDDSRPLSADYFAGLNHLLNQQPDEALEAFTRMVDVEGESVETHFALGSLFRRRGEVDRAIRLHQNLLARPDLSREHRDQTLFELGEDYLRAGLFDRAEALFRQVSETRTHGVAALDSLVRIFELQKDWEQAIEARRKLGKLRPDEDESRMIAHYYCELAQKSLAATDLPAAREYLKKAQAGRERTVRGALMRGDVAARMGDHKLAADLYRRVLDDDKTFLPEVLPRLRRALVAAGSGNEFSSVLEAYIAKDPGARAAVAYAAILNDLLDDRVSAACVTEYIRTQPTLKEIYGSFDHADDRATIARICRALRLLAERTPRYSCRQCGFQSASLFWQCPGCKAWDTIRPNSRFHFAALIDPAAY